MRIALGADHGGWELKEAIKTILQELGHQVQDFGTHDEASVDYPDFGEAVASAVAEGRAERGILVCGTGIGMCMVANKHPGIRAALCHDLYTARLSREHNDANILVLGGRVVGKGLALEMVKVWLSTDFLGGRHSRRLQKIAEWEERLREKGARCGP
ncbi:MAG: ribose 5-phosphate isomerase B [candidate division NC10 bacterium]|nr:ribose 5-phosphate isomerase B [candidate division NC10 bacterium]